MVVLDIDDHDRIPRFAFFDFEDQSKLFVEPHGVLVLPPTLQFLKMERFESIEVSFVFRRADCLHPHSEGSHYAGRKTSRVMDLLIDSLENAVSVSKKQPLSP